MKIVSSAAQ